ncbi:MAG: hypothetical protein IPP49_20050 [Saprospiraceae bacterium]|nr:hypothetical protein [Saprospiraceae bacterium]
MPPPSAITVSPLVNTTYTVTVTDANGCTKTANASVNVDPGIHISPQNITVYLGANGSSQYKPTGYFHWKHRSVY